LYKGTHTSNTLHRQLYSKNQNGITLINNKLERFCKLEKQFRELSLKKGQDPEIWITESEDLRVRLEAMGSSISDNQFMIHILNNLTSDYELQLAFM
jgi:hypothetical protein